MPLVFLKLNRATKDKGKTKPVTVPGHLICWISPYEMPADPALETPFPDAKTSLKILSGSGTFDLRVVEEPGAIELALQRLGCAIADNII